MSGGSFNYLFNKDASELAAGYNEDTIERMAVYLASAGYDVEARFTYEILHLLRMYKVKMDFLLLKIQPMWRGVEWESSGDGADLKQLSEEFRKI